MYIVPIKNAKATMTDCKFMRTQTIKASNDRGDGGAIYIDIGDQANQFNMTMDNCEFNNNQALLKGGVIKIDSKIEQIVNLNITNSKFTDFYSKEGSILYF